MCNFYYLWCHVQKQQEVIDLLVSRWEMIPLWDTKMAANQEQMSLMILHRKFKFSGFMALIKYKFQKKNLRHDICGVLVYETSDSITRNWTTTRKFSTMFEFQVQ